MGMTSNEPDQHRIPLVGRHAPVLLRSVGAAVIRPISDNDILVWPDGTWCFREVEQEYAWMGDDYIVLPAGSAEHAAHLASQEV